ncbi:hypothetical protein PHABIO_386 [Pseudomonas phage Phabio]|uniref:Uncharacterized protein n=1 Tax=Pseudomonas phage Phabio TaxID=2006668 RepID=A0A1Y0T2D3_9CAUD|nr:hypothetical protein MZD05_gp386 [Pseudomonas phage Phabio]ARV77017.1 hypothetical protein PHABIO_386 [Pseudomonas phage Phabio]
MNNQLNVVTEPTQQAWEDYVDNRVLNVASIYDVKPELTFAQRLEMMQDLLADLSIELYNNVKDKAMRSPMMAYVTKIENRLAV